MKKINIAYPELVSAIAKDRIRKTTIAKEIGISPRTLYSKLVGESDFTWLEALRIQKRFFPDIPIDKLFKNPNEEAGAWND